jgi:hypothetical protein
MPELNLSSVLQKFGHSVFIDKNLDELVLCLEAMHDNEDGWLYKSHFVSIDADDIFVYLRAFLADRILRKSDIIFWLTKSLLGGDNAVAIDIALLRRVFLGTKKQTLKDDGIGDLLQAFENPRKAVSTLKEANEAHATGWIKSRWFTSSGNKQRKTELEGKAMRAHQLLSYGSAKSAEDIEAIRNALGYAWETSSVTLHRNLVSFYDKHVSDPIVKYTSRSVTIAHRTKLKPDDTLFEPRFKGQVGTTATPARTRARGGFVFKNEPPTASAVKETPNKEQAPQSSPIAPRKHQPRAPSLPILPQKQSGAATAKLLPKEEVLMPAWLSKEFHALATVFAAGKQESVNLKYSLQEDESICQQLEYEEDLQVPSQQDEDFADLPLCDRQSSHVVIHDDDDRSESSSDLPPFDSLSASDLLPTSDLSAILENQSREDEQFFEERMQEREEAKLDKRYIYASNLLEVVCNLAALGSSAIQATMKAILVASMPNRNATQYLVDSGFAEKKQNRAIERKKAENKARTRKAEKENRVPSLIEEVARQEFRAPLKNTRAASKAQRDYNHLAQGQDLPKPI